MKKVAFYTLGCKLNFAETSTIGRQFIGRGFEVVDFDQPSDVYVLNTCSVTERADRECRQIIRRALRVAPNAYVIVIGCYAQLQSGEIASIDGVDLILGSSEKFNIFNYENKFFKQSTPQIFISCIDDTNDFDAAFSADVGGRTRAFLKIQDGCDYSCSFCTIPLARGESRSAHAESIIHQAESIASQGYKEIVLTGVNVGDYGKNNNSCLYDLMKKLDHVEGIDRIRIGSIEPNLLTNEIIYFILSSNKFCNHFHVPLQSGSNAVLKLMRRRYSVEDYRKLIEFIRQNDPDAGIGVDVIAGFPGETDSLFRETYKFLDDLPISYLHVFTYSERPNTLAAEFTGSVEPKIRFERSEILRELSNRKRYSFYSSFVEKNLDVLYEGNTNKGKISGLSTNYIRVEVESDLSIINQIRKTKIVSAENKSCIGEVMNMRNSTLLTEVLSMHS
jgi:threonylcarbamoyladenosine tRNA methylthiotransferase MtaB